MLVKISIFCQNIKKTSQNVEVFGQNQKYIVQNAEDFGQNLENIGRNISGIITLITYIYYSNISQTRVKNLPCGSNLF